VGEIGRPQIGAPEPISQHHDLGRFDCGNDALNDWLKSKALKSEGVSARCMVVIAENAVIGYYCISTGAVAHRDAPRALRANLPNPTPVMVLGRLAVDRQFHGRGIGSGMLKDALRRILQASGIVGARAVIVHAIDDAAVPFYAGYSFKSFPTDNRTLFLAIDAITKAL
jgi:GNAT superfamily N-acetyltransferase